VTLRLPLLAVALSLPQLAHAQGLAGNRQTSGDGRWTALGTAQAGKIIVTLDDGSREELPYQAGAQGDKWPLSIDGTGSPHPQRPGRL